jgi:hypothetical protein
MEETMPIGAQAAPRTADVHKTEEMEKAANDRGYSKLLIFKYP